MQKTVFFFALLLFAVLSPLVSEGKMKVVASIHPVADIVRTVGGDKVTVTTLLPPAASPHTFEPTPKLMTELSDAALFIKIGAGLEFWAEKMVKAVSNRNLTVVDLSQGMPLLHGIEEMESEHGHGHSHGGNDPHYWLDPVLAKRMVDRITEALVKKDPANSAYYKDHAARYKAELDRLNDEIAREVGQFTTKEYVTFHAAWSYFSRRYGLKVLGIIEEAPGREPTPITLARMVKDLRKIRARVVFAEPQFSPRIAEAIAQEAGAKVLLLDPIGSPTDPGKDTYLKLMRYNIAQMRKAMR
ncbi:MAG: zinc ABC transporter substrate-binding protein [Nitrospirales bacterium]|nr:zinc ABC transporter substrate-binding protein [Nitrospirales bacterium]